MPKEKSNILEKLKKLVKEQKEKEKKKEKKKKKSKESASSRDNARTPMTKEDYEKKRSVIRTVYDAETGRMRRVRGTGEIMETIVTREQHRQINKTATMTDGLTYQSKLYKATK